MFAYSNQRLLASCIYDTITVCLIFMGLGGTQFDLLPPLNPIILTRGNSPDITNWWKLHKVCHWSLTAYFADRIR